MASAVGPHHAARGGDGLEASADPTRPLRGDTHVKACANKRALVTSVAKAIRRESQLHCTAGQSQSGGLIGQPGVAWGHEGWGGTCTLPDIWEATSVHYSELLA